MILLHSLKTAPPRCWDQSQSRSITLMVNKVSVCTVPHATIPALANRCRRIKTSRLSSPTYQAESHQRLLHIKIAQMTNPKNQKAGEKRYRTFLKFISRVSIIRALNSAKSSTPKLDTPILRFTQKNGGSGTATIIL